MRVCYFGPYDPEYPRNRVIIKGLRENGVDVVECNSQSVNRISNYLKLLRRHQTLKYDVIILGARGIYYGQPLVPFIKRLTNKPVVFDAILTLYERSILDRKTHNANSFKANLLYLLDYNALHGASLVLSDTKAHSRYYSRFYAVDSKNFTRVLVGSDDEVFYPRDVKREDGCFHVVFWGGFIPLQGVKYIIKAAKLLENHKDIQFELRGFGQTYKETLELSKGLKVENVTYVSNWLPYHELPEYIAKADICLGIFGETEKAQRVVPNKAVEALAMRKPLITGNSSAAREILANMDNSILVPMANSKILADAILTLKEDRTLRDRIAERGYQLFREKLTSKVIGRKLKLALTELVKKKNY
jgi:glycosyltransferase involved in cell wall biosynthesis